MDTGLTPVTANSVEVLMAFCPVNGIFRAKPVPQYGNLLGWHLAVLRRATYRPGGWILCTPRLRCC